MDRIFVTIDGEEREIFPVDYRNGKFVTEREQGWIFFRTKFQGSIDLRGDDFEDFIALGEDCSKQLIRIEREGLDDWNGYFSITDGTINLDDCTFIFTPRTDDGYDAFLDKGSQPYNIMEQPRVTVNIPAPFSKSHTNCRMLEAVIQGMIDVIDSSYTLSSAFLNDATNPVTGLANKYRYLAIAQLSDAKRPTAPDKVRFAYMSFLEMMTMLRDTLNVWWSIDGANIVLEHYIHYRTASVEDLTADRGDTRAQRYLFDMSKMWKFERWESLNRGSIDGGIDFVDQGFAYEGTCLLPKDNELKRTVGIATDAEGIIDAVDSFSDDGFFLFQGSGVNGGDCLVSIGYVSGMNKVNGGLSWANLLDQFWRDGRVLMEATHFTNPEDFVSAEPNKQQLLTVSLCADVDYYGKFKTELGNSLGVDGRLVRAERSTNGGTTRLTLAYGYPDGVRPSPVEPGKTVTIYQSDLDPNTLVATFSELSGLVFKLQTNWEVWQGVNLIDSGYVELITDENVLYQEFATPFPAYDPSYCYILDITSSDLDWTVIVNQAPILKC
jgi:hypothetical protein